MRYTARVSVVALLALIFTAPTVALAQSGASVGGFGGLSLNALQSQPPSLGGTVTFNVVPGIQIVGEAGRIGSVLPMHANSVFSLAQTDLRASVFYGEGGVTIRPFQLTPRTTNRRTSARRRRLLVSIATAANVGPPALYSHRGSAGAGIIAVTRQN